ncbi:hypothetical protein H9P43_009840 [Blastocladiella emersonii ATCC 22665]|nr:hypothetical protein H9P43_009840 [Blastocladiella emersonii ATCC 22665]
MDKVKAENELLRELLIAALASKSDKVSDIVAAIGRSRSPNGGGGGGDGDSHSSQQQQPPPLNPPPGPGSSGGGGGGSGSVHPLLPHAQPIDRAQPLPPASHQGPPLHPHHHPYGHQRANGYRHAHVVNDIIASAGHAPPADYDQHRPYDYAQPPPRASAPAPSDPHFPAHAAYPPPLAHRHDDHDYYRHRDHEPSPPPSSRAWPHHPAPPRPPPALSSHLAQRDHEHYGDPYQYPDRPHHHHHHHHPPRRPAPDASMLRHDSYPNEHPHFASSVPPPAASRASSYPRQHRDASAYPHPLPHARDDPVSHRPPSPASASGRESAGPIQPTHVLAALELVKLGPDVLSGLGVDHETIAKLATNLQSISAQSAPPSRPPSAPASSSTRSAQHDALVNGLRQLTESPAPGSSAASDTHSRLVSPAAAASAPMAPPSRPPSIPLSSSHAVRRQSNPSPTPPPPRIMGLPSTHNPMFGHAFAAAGAPAPPPPVVGGMPAVRTTPRSIHHAPVQPSPLSSHFDAHDFGMGTGSGAADSDAAAAASAAARAMHIAVDREFPGLHVGVHAPSSFNIMNFAMMNGADLGLDFLNAAATSQPADPAASQSQQHRFSGAEPMQVSDPPSQQQQLSLDELWHAPPNLVSTSASPAPPHPHAATPTLTDPMAVSTPPHPHPQQQQDQSMDAATAAAAAAAQVALDSLFPNDPFALCDPTAGGTIMPAQPSLSGFGQHDPFGQYPLLGAAALYDPANWVTDAWLAAATAGLSAGAPLAGPAPPPPTPAMASVSAGTSHAASPFLTGTGPLAASGLAGFASSLSNQQHQPHQQQALANQSFDPSACMADQSWTMAADPSSSSSSSALPPAAQLGGPSAFAADPLSIDDVQAQLMAMLDIEDFAAVAATDTDLADPRRRPVVPIGFDDEPLGFAGAERSRHQLHQQPPTIAPARIINGGTAGGGSTSGRSESGAVAPRHRVRGRTASVVGATANDAMEAAMAAAGIGNDEDGAPARPRAVGATTTRGKRGRAAKNPDRRHNPPRPPAVVVAASDMLVSTSASPPPPPQPQQQEQQQQHEVRPAYHENPFFHPPSHQHHHHHHPQSQHDLPPLPPLPPSVGGAPELPLQPAAPAPAPTPAPASSPGAGDELVLGANDEPPKQCENENCRVQFTPLWRRGFSDEILCNAVKQNGRHRPRELCRHPAKPPPVNTNVCANCNTSEASLWRKGSQGECLCNACALYEKLHNKHRPPEIYANKVVKRRNRAPKRTAAAAALDSSAAAADGSSASSSLTSSSPLTADGDSPVPPKPKRKRAAAPRKRATTVAAAAAAAAAAASGDPAPAESSSASSPTTAVYTPSHPHHAHHAYPLAHPASSGPAAPNPVLAIAEAAAAAAAAASSSAAPSPLSSLAAAAALPFFAAHGAAAAPRRPDGGDDPDDDMDTS